MDNLYNEQKLYVEVIHPTTTLDLYLKSSILDVINRADETDQVNPFFKPIYIYSNVENGTGIFAGYNSIQRFIE